MDLQPTTSGAASANALARREPVQAPKNEVGASELRPPAGSPATTTPQVVSSMQESTNSGKATTQLPGQNEQSQEYSRDQVEAAVEDINDFFQSMERSVQFSLDKESERMVVQIKDGEGNLVKQIPSEQALELARHLDKVKGLLFEAKA